MEVEAAQVVCAPPLAGIRTLSMPGSGSRGSNIQGADDAMGAPRLVSLRRSNEATSDKHSCALENAPALRLLLMVQRLRANSQPGDGPAHGGGSDE
eukprot:scaffold417834_cov48-Prasinocladus_malaysianus.AAC.1